MCINNFEFLTLPNILAYMSESTFFFWKKFSYLQICFSFLLWMLLKCLVSSFRRVPCCFKMVFWVVLASFNIFWRTAGRRASVPTNQNKQKATRWKCSTWTSLSYLRVIGASCVSGSWAWHLVLLMRDKFSVLSLQAQHTYTSKSIMQWHFSEQAALNTCALGCLSKLYENYWCFLNILKVIFIF